MSSSTRLLAIDDNATNLAILQEALQDSYDVELAHDGIEGLALAPAIRPDVILLDVAMPGLDGYEVCRRIKLKSDLRQCRIIMVSAKTSLEDRLMGFDAGADDYVTKPFDDEELRTKIEFAIRAKRMEQLCGATGEILAVLSWVRDSGTVDDLSRTRLYARVLTEELRGGPYEQQIDDRFLDDMYYASVLRDVGKLAVPASVRDKPQPLSADEIEQLKQHTLIGSRLMNRFAGEHPDISVFGMASAAARSHHENFDGSGYPDRLRGEAIPLAARLLAVVDTLDTATCEGSPPMPFALCGARDEVVQGTGTRFDPVVANAFVSVFDQMEDLADDVNAASAR